MRDDRRGVGPPVLKETDLEGAYRRLMEVQGIAAPPDLDAPPPGGGARALRRRNGWRGKRRAVP